MQRRTTLTLLMLLLLATSGSVAQDSAAYPCDTPEMHQFDFWLGEWDCSFTTTDSAGHDTTLTVSNRITRILDSCVILEEFDGPPAISLRGRSFSTYDFQLDKWRQVWVDNNGSYLDFIGEYNDGLMDLRRETTRNDSTFIQRILYKNITPESLTWHWERSDDGGETWRVLWVLEYQRRE